MWKEKGKLERERKREKKGEEEGGRRRNTAKRFSSLLTFFSEKSGWMRMLK